MPKLRIAIISAVVVVTLSLFYLFLVSPAIDTIYSARRLKSSLAQIEQVIKTQDLAATNKQLDAIGQDLTAFKSNYSRLGWLGYMPIVNIYYADGSHGLSSATDLLDAAKIAAEAIVPYADAIGLKAFLTTPDQNQTAQEKINLLIEALDKLKPQLSQIGAKLDHAQKQASFIKPSRYPKSLRPRISSALDLLDNLSTLTNNARPLLENLSFIVGKTSPRTYLVIFQNDAELRPTGGFMTAYGVISVDKGKIDFIQSDDIYTLDDKFLERIPAPEPIKKYLPNVPYWYLRDQNLSPDFKTSMDTFYPNYLLTKSPPVDAVIAVDTQLLVNLLKVTGPISVPDFGTFSADIDKRCNCPQAFYELELYADVEGPVVWDSVTGQIVYQPRNYGQRKSFIGPVSNALINSILGQPKQRLPDVFNHFFSSIQQKHILFYFLDPQIQTAVESFNMAGRIQESDGDYLAVVDTNFAGAKTNAWVTYTAEQKIEVSSDGTIIKTLVLTYKNPQKYFEDPKTKLRLNGVFRDWLRVYVPKGSQLLEAKGFETGQAVGEDLGKTVFEGFFTLTPLNVKTITLKYKLPFKTKSPYKLLIQKQGGSKDFPYRITINGHRQPEFNLSSDQQLLLSY